MFHMNTDLQNLIRRRLLEIILAVLLLACVGFCLVQWGTATSLNTSLSSVQGDLKNAKNAQASLTIQLKSAIPGYQTQVQLPGSSTITTFEVEAQKKSIVIRQFQGDITHPYVYPLTFQNSDPKQLSNIQLDFYQTTTGLWIMDVTGNGGTTHLALFRYNASSGQFTLIQ